MSEFQSNWLFLVCKFKHVLHCTYVLSVFFGGLLKFAYLCVCCLCSHLLREPEVCGKVRNRLGRYDTIMVPDECLDSGTIPELVACTSVVMTILVHWCMTRTQEGRLLSLDAICYDCVWNLLSVSFVMFPLSK